MSYRYVHRKPPRVVAAPARTFVLGQDSEPGTAPSPSKPFPWKNLIAAGSVGVLTLGLVYGMARASRGGDVSRYRWGGL